MLQDQINKDYIQAMKQRDAVRSATLSFLRSQIKNVMIDRKTEVLEDAQVITLVKKQVKQRQDSIEQYERGERPDLAEKEKKEQEILAGYLPREMPDEKLNGLVQEAIQETGAGSLRDMGRVMKAVLSKTAGQADNQKVSLRVREALSRM